MGTNSPRKPGEAGPPPPAEPGPAQVPGFDERDAQRGHRDNADIEGGPGRGRPTPVDTEGT